MNTAHNVGFHGASSATSTTEGPGIKMPFNWDISLFASFADINARPDVQCPIREVYAADKSSLTGSGRTSSAVKDRNLPIGAYIDEAHRCGIKFEYLWNAATLSGDEWNHEFQTKLYQEAKNLIEWGVDSFTVTNPVLCLKLKQWFPSVTITVSVNNHLDSAERVEQWLGYTRADRILLDNRRSRSFNLIRKIRERQPQRPIVILANEACLPDCVLQPYHQEHQTMASRAGADFHAPDLFRTLCSIRKLENPVYSLKAPWIRPEDTHYLFVAGVTLIKLAGRTESSEWMREAALAYAIGHYDGDVWKFIDKPGSVRPEWQTLLGKRLDPCRFEIPNSLLDGFIEPFVKNTVSCVNGHNGCGSCDWCESWMHVVTIPPDMQQRLQDLRHIRDHQLTDIQALQPELIRG